jgi:hypothetical protein
MDPKKLTDGLLDAAACEALGANAPTESAAYQQELAAAGEDARRADRELRETVARLAAASPHLAPPPDLRGKILQATAPVTFRMEDYRKATQEPSRFFKWGFYAAMLFLMAGAYYNINLQSKLQQTVQTAKAIEAQSQEREAALATLLSPGLKQVKHTDAAGNPYALTFYNEQTQTAVSILPKEIVESNKRAIFNFENTEYKTVVVAVPGGSVMPSLTLPQDRSTESVLKVVHAVADPTAQPKVASQSPLK